MAAAARRARLDPWYASISPLMSLDALLPVALLISLVKCRTSHLISLCCSRTHRREEVSNQEVGKEVDKEVDKELVVLWMARPRTRVPPLYSLETLMLLVVVVVVAVVVVYALLAGIIIITLTAAPALLAAIISQSNLDPQSTSVSHTPMVATSLDTRCLRMRHPLSLRRRRLPLVPHTRCQHPPRCLLHPICTACSTRVPRGETATCTSLPPRRHQRHHRHHLIRALHRIPWRCMPCKEQVSSARIRMRCRMGSPLRSRPLYLFRHHQHLLRGVLGVVVRLHLNMRMD